MDGPEGCGWDCGFLILCLASSRPFFFCHEIIIGFLHVPSKRICGREDSM
jgi:hypothetical protein